MMKIIALLLLSIPLIGTIFYLLKILGALILREKTGRLDLDRVTKYLGLTLLVLMLMISTSLAIFMAVLIISPDALKTIPIIFQMLGLVGVMVFYFCGVGFIQGVGKAVEVSNISAKTIFTEIYNSFSIKQ